MLPPLVAAYLNDRGAPVWRDDEEDAATMPLEVENRTMDGHPQYAPVTYGMRARNISDFPITAVTIWLVRRRDDRDPEDTPDATDQWRIDSLEPGADWSYFRLTQSIGFESPYALHHAAIVGSWRDPVGIRDSGELGSTHVY